MRFIFFFFFYTRYPVVVATFMENTAFFPYWVTLVACWKSVSVKSSVVFFLQIILAILHPLHFHVSVRICFSVFIKTLRILIGVSLNLYVYLGRIDILTILSLLYFFILFRLYYSFQCIHFVYILQNLSLTVLWGFFDSVVYCILLFQFPI